MNVIVKEPSQKNNSIQTIKLTDLISIDLLQQLQDRFATETNVASIIIDLDGNQITKPSNFSTICSMIQITELGRQQCNNSDEERKQIASSIDQPTYLKCHPCGFADASIPVNYKGNRIADWLVGQVNLNDADKNEIADYASIIGIDILEMLIAFDKMPKLSPSYFEKIIKLLYKISTEIMDMIYQESQSNDFDIASLNNSIHKKFNFILDDFLQNDIS